MRVLIVTFALCFALVAGAAAQQANSSNDEPKEKKTKSTEQAAKPQDKKPSQATEKATEPRLSLGRAEAGCRETRD